MEINLFLFLYASAVLPSPIFQPFTPISKIRSTSRLLRLAVWWVGEVLLLTTLAEHLVFFVPCRARAMGRLLLVCFANKKQ